MPWLLAVLAALWCVERWLAGWSPLLLEVPTAVILLIIHQLRKCKHDK